ncbi:MAG: Rieske 2Fe-2S domain-containing protein [Candidatus Kapaibacterium sp.]
MCSNNNGELPIIESEGRRSFFSQCAGAMVGLTVIGTIAPILQGCSSSPTAPNGPAQITVDVSSLDADNKAVLVGDQGTDGKSVVVVRKTATTYLVLSMTCTHDECEVGAPNSSGIMICPCHGSKFDITGAVKQGPASSPLGQYTSTFNEATKMLTIKFR